MERMKLFSGTSHPLLAQKIANALHIELGNVRIDRFRSGEIYVHFEESVRNRDIFLVQTFCHPVNEHIMELLVMADAARRASARSITAVIPYFAYARQEKKDAPREPISAKMIADLLTTVGISRVISFDLHAPAIQGFFNIPLDHLTMLDSITEYLRNKQIKNPVVVSPDAGRAKTAERLATFLDAPFAIMMKKRPAHNAAKVTHIIGEVEERTPIIIEDMIDTGGTIISVVENLRKKGANPAYICATHPVFSGNALERLCHPAIQEVVVGDTLPVEMMNSKVQVLCVASLLAEAIKINISGGSISTLFRASM